MSDQTSKTGDSTDLNQSPRLTMRRLESADPIELKPMSLDEFDEVVSSRAPSSPVVKRASTTKPESPAKTSGAVPSASTGFGDFGAEVESLVRRSAPIDVATTSRFSSDAVSDRRPSPQASSTYDAKATQTAPRPSATKPAPNPAEQPTFKPTSSASDVAATPARPTPARPTPAKSSPTIPAKPPSAASNPRPSTSSASASKPAVPRFDPKTGKPLAGNQENPFARPQNPASPSPMAPRFDTKTGKPLAGNQENPFARPQNPASPSPMALRFDTKTGKPLAADQKTSNDPFGGTPSVEFDKLQKGTEEPTEPKKKAPQIGCLPAIVLVGASAILFKENGAVLAVLGILIVNTILHSIFGDKSESSEEEENS